MDQDLINDAIRYKKLKQLAFDGCLESFVALNQLDFLQDNSKFDSEIDKTKDTKS